MKAALTFLRDVVLYGLIMGYLVLGWVPAADAQLHGGGGAATTYLIACAVLLAILAAPLAREIKRARKEIRRG